jgi:NADPH:quinone reductase-like Zn-dependent oxidoreductase
MQGWCSTFGHGIDVFFDNVGGVVLNEVLARLRLKARIVLCGAISRDNDVTLAPGPGNDIAGPTADCALKNRVAALGQDQESGFARDETSQGCIVKPRGIPALVKPKTA